MWAVIAVVFIVFVVLFIYYNTIGYYLEIGWKRIYTLIRGKQDVDVDVEDTGIGGSFKHMEESAPPAPDVRPIGMPGAIEASPSIFSSLHADKKEVFNVSRNIYTYADAPAVCSALGAELATYEQVKMAYDKGADWCNYGWSKGQMALYPTQKETYEKLQKSSSEFRNACGNVGLNGGYFDNPELRFGVNCYGDKPAQKATDELQQSSVALPQSASEIEYDKKVQKFREQLSTTTVLPFRRGSWSE